MICRNKCEGIEKISPGVPIKIWVISLQEDNYVLVKLGSITDAALRVKYSFLLKENYEV